MKNLFFALFAMLYSSITITSINEINRQKNIFFDGLTSSRKTDAYLYMQILAKPYLLHGPIRLNPNQTAASVCISTKRYDLLLRILNSNMAIDLTTESQAQYSRNMQHWHSNNQYDLSTPLHSICSQHDPSYNEIRARVICAMLKKNPSLANIASRAGIYPIEKCIRFKTTHSLLAFQLKPIDLRSISGIASYRHNPYLAKNNQPI